MEKQRLRKAKVTKQVVQPGTELTCSTILQAQKKMGAKGRAENSELMMELAQKHMAVDEVWFAGLRWKKKTINNIKPCWKPLTWSSRLLPTYLVINKSQTVPTLHRPQLLKGPIVLFWNCHLCSDILSCFLSLGVPIQSSCPSSVISLALSCLYCTITFTWQWELLINWNGTKPLDSPLSVYQGVYSKFLDETPGECRPLEGQAVH